MGWGWGARGWGEARRSLARSLAGGPGRRAGRCRLLSNDFFSNWRRTAALMDGAALGALAAPAPQSIRRATTAGRAPPPFVVGEAAGAPDLPATPRPPRRLGPAPSVLTPRPAARAGWLLSPGRFRGRRRSAGGGRPRDCPLTLPPRPRFSRAPQDRSRSRRRRPPLRVLSGWSGKGSLSPGRSPRSLLPGPSPAPTRSSSAPSAFCWNRTVVHRHTPWGTALPVC